MLGCHDACHVAGDEGLCILQQQGVGLVICTKIKAGSGGSVAELFGNVRSCGPHHCRFGFFHRVDGGILAGLSILQSVLQDVVHLVVLQRLELRRIRQEVLRGEQLIIFVVQVVLLGQQVAFLPDAAALVPEPEPAAVVGVQPVVRQLLADHIHLHFLRKCVILRGDVIGESIIPCSSSVFQHRRAFCTCGVAVGCPPHCGGCTPAGWCT